MAMMLILIGVMVFGLFFSERRSGFAATSSVAALLLGPDELPIKKCVLFQLTLGGVHFGRFGREKLQIEEKWLYLKENDNERKRALNIAFVIATNSNQAEQFAKGFKRTPVPITEINDKRYLQLVDQAWGNDGRFVFVKNKIACEITISQADGENADELYSIVKLAADKIDALLAGKSMPIPLMPMSCAELQQDFWFDNDMATMCWGKDALTLAIMKDGIPRAVPAGKIGRTNDYQVPLRYIAAILDPQAGVKIKENTATVTLLGKAISLTAGNTAVTCDGKAVKIAAPVVIKSGHVLVPLSMFGATVDKPINWRKEGKRTIGSF